MTKVEFWVAQSLASLARILCDPVHSVAFSLSLFAEEGSVRRPA